MDFSSSCFCYSRISLKMNCRAPALMSRRNQPTSYTLIEKNSDIVNQREEEFGTKFRSGANFLGGSRVIIQLNLQRTLAQRKRSAVTACLPSSEIASTVFTLGTAAVLPIYTLMVVAPKTELVRFAEYFQSEILVQLSFFCVLEIKFGSLILYSICFYKLNGYQTRKVMKSSIPYIGFGLLYAYLLYLSWTPDTIRLMFASKYWLPELPGITKMFSNEMTLASAWIHLLAVDLFAARQVYHDGLQNDIETRHSVSLCLLFCPIGIVTHFITKALTSSTEKRQRRTH